jgi:hypothetical protein
VTVLRVAPAALARTTLPIWARPQFLASSADFFDRIIRFGGFGMSLFFVLPPRPLLGEHFAAYLRGLFPGLDWDVGARSELAEVVAAVISRPDLYVVFREELPAGESTHAALIDGFGAEPGDEVVEVKAGSRPGELLTRRSLLRPAA